MNKTFKLINGDILLLKENTAYETWSMAGNNYVKVDNRIYTVKNFEDVILDEDDNVKD